MRTYQLELLDATGRVERTIDAVCVDDEEALLRAGALRHPHVVIVRHALRRVGDVRENLIVPRVAIVD